MAILKYAKNVAASVLHVLPSVAESEIPSVHGLLGQAFSKDQREAVADQLTETRRILREDVGVLMRKGLDNLNKAAKTGSLASSAEDELDEEFGDLFSSADFDNSLLEEGAAAPSAGSGPAPGGGDARRAAAAAASAVRAIARSMRDDPNARMTSEATQATARFTRASLGAQTAIGNAIRQAMASNARMLGRVHHFQVSVQRDYYQNSLREQASIRQALREMTARLDTLIQSSVITASATDQAMMLQTGHVNDFTKAFDSRGGINLAGYLGVMNARMRGKVGQGSLFNMVAKTVLAQPARLIAEEVTKGIGYSLLPFQRQLAQFNSFVGKLGVVLSERASHFAGRLRESAGFFGAKTVGKRGLAALLDFLSVRSGEAPRRPDLTSKINDRPVAFDGFSRRAIVEVIPNYLSHIHAELAAMRRKMGLQAPDRMVYDYRSGVMQSAKAARKEVEDKASRASLGEFDDVRRRLGGAGYTRVADSAFGALRDSGFQFKRGDADSYHRQLVELAAKLQKAGKARQATALRGMAGKIRDVAASDPATASRFILDIQHAIETSRNTLSAAYAAVGGPGSEGGARWSYASDLAGDLGVAGGDIAAGRTSGPKDWRWAGRKRGGAWEGDRYERGLKGSVFRDADTGRVTARSLLGSPAKAISLALDRIERGVSDALFGAPGGRGGALGAIRRGLVGDKGPGGARGGIFGGVYEMLLGSGEGGGRKGVLVRFKETILQAADRTAEFLLGKRGADGKRSGGVFSGLANGARSFVDGLVKGTREKLLAPLGRALGSVFGGLKESAFGPGARDKKLADLLGAALSRALEPVTAGLKKAFGWLKEKAFDPLVKWVGDPKTGIIAVTARKMTGFLDTVNERMFGKGGIMSRIEGSINRFFYGDPSKGVPGFVQRVIEPARDFLKREIWEPMKASIKGMWDESLKFIRKELVEPLKGVMKPFTDEVRHQYQQLKEWVKGPLREAFTGAIRAVGAEINKTFQVAFGKSLSDMLRENVLNPIKDALGGVRKFLGTALSSILRIPVNVLRTVSEDLRVSQLRRGVATGISAEERARLIEKHGLDPAAVPHSGGSSIASPAAAAPGRMEAAQARAAAAAAGRGSGAAIALGGPARAAAPGPEHLTGGGPTVHSGDSAVRAAAAAVHSAPGPEAAGRAAEAAADAAGTAGTGAHPGAYGKRATLQGMTTVIRDATRATADNTKNIYGFMVRNMWGLGANVERIARKMGALGRKGAGGGPDGDRRGGVRGFLGRLFSDPLGAISGLFTSVLGGAASILKGAAKRIGDVILLPFRVVGKAIGKTIGAFNSTLGWMRKNLSQVVGVLGDGLKALAKGVGVVARELIKVTGTIIREAAHAAGHIASALGDALFGKAGPDGKRKGGIIGGLASAAVGITKGLISVGGSLLTLGGHLLRFTGQLIATVGGLAWSATKGLAGGVARGLGLAVPGLSGRGGAARLTPVFVMGGRLAGTRGGAETIAEAQAGMAHSVKGTAARLGGLFRGAPADQEEEGDGDHRKRSGWMGFRARSAAEGLTKSMAEWRARSLAAGEAAAGHLKYIRSGFSAVGSMLMAAVPAIMGALAAIWEWFKHGGLVRTIGGMLGGPGGLGALWRDRSGKVPNPLGGGGASAAEDALGAAAGGGAAPGGSRLAAFGEKVGGRMGKLGGLAGRVLGKIPGVGGLLARGAGMAAGPLGKAAGGLLGGLGRGGLGLVKGIGGFAAKHAGIAGLAGWGIDAAADAFLPDTGLGGAAKKVAKTGGSMLEYGAMGAMLGGPIGGAIGAAAGALIENWGAIGKGLSWAGHALGGAATAVVGGLLGGGKAVLKAVTSKTALLGVGGYLLGGPLGAMAGAALGANWDPKLGLLGNVGHTIGNTIRFFKNNLVGPDADTSGKGPAPAQPSLLARVANWFDPSHASDAAGGGASPLASPAAPAPGTPQARADSAVAAQTGSVVAQAKASPAAARAAAAAPMSASPAADGAYSGSAKPSASAPGGSPDAIVGRYAGKGPVGSGQCVALVQAATGVGHTSRWAPGAHVLGSQIPSGTPIATFGMDGRYENKTDGSSHAAIYLGPAAGGISVLDQWKGHAPAVRTIRNKGGRGLPCDDASCYKTIMVGTPDHAAFTAATQGGVRGALNGHSAAGSPSAVAALNKAFDSKTQAAPSGPLNGHSVAGSPSAVAASNQAFAGATQAAPSGPLNGHSVAGSPSAVSSSNQAFTGATQAAPSGPTGGHSSAGGGSAAAGAFTSATQGGYKGGPGAAHVTPEQLNAAMNQAGITDPAFRAGIAAISAGESGFKMSAEASYANTSNARIRSIFRTATAGLSDAQLSAVKKDPKKWFNLVYGGRLGNGRGTDDGYNYRGRGLIQLTGRANYAKYGKLAGVDIASNPDLLNDPAIAAKVTVAYMKDRYKGGGFEGMKRAVGNAVAATEPVKDAAFARYMASGAFAPGQGGMAPPGAMLASAAPGPRPASSALASGSAPPAGGPPMPMAPVSAGAAAPGAPAPGVQMAALMGAPPPPVAAPDVSAGVGAVATQRAAAMAMAQPAPAPMPAPPPPQQVAPSQSDGGGGKLVEVMQACLAELKNISAGISKVGAAAAAAGGSPAGSGASPPGARGGSTYAGGIGAGPGPSAIMKRVVAGDTAVG